MSYNTYEIQFILRTPEKSTIDVLSGSFMVCLFFKEEYGSFVSYLNWG